jgi:hypothetical protein
MAITDEDIREAEDRMRARLDETPRAVSARYDRNRSRIIVDLSNGLELAFPPQLAEGLDNAGFADLEKIEISPTGLGLHWPALDADLYVPALLHGVFGSPAWTARVLGRTGGQSRSPAKIDAARENGKRGGRPRKAIP